MVSNSFYFHPYLGKIPILTNIFQRGWNHQLENLDWWIIWDRDNLEFRSQGPKVCWGEIQSFSFGNSWGIQETPKKFNKILNTNPRRSLELKSGYEKNRRFFQVNHQKIMQGLSLDVEDIYMFVCY